MNDMSRPSLLPDPARPGPHDPVARMSEMLTAQAGALDALFARLVGQTEENLTAWPVAAETYARLAFRAQWNCRASLEAVARADYRAAVLRRAEGQ
jgi:hypothetical protein